MYRYVRSLDLAAERDRESL